MATSKATSVSVLVLALTAASAARPVRAAELLAIRMQTASRVSRHEVFTATSKDGTPIAVECAGTGPSLLFVHGGVGDRSRWTPLFPLLTSRFRACAMDRRGRGDSADHPDYSLRKEAEDVAAVVNSLPGPVVVFGHSYGAVVALEQTEIVQLSSEEIARMKARPTWAALVASIAVHSRQMRPLAAYRFDPRRMRSMPVPTLLLLGEKTASPYARQSIRALQESLPHSTLVVLDGQEHSAMEGGRELLADAILRFAVH